MADNKQRDQLEELVRQAWTLSDAEIESIQPGNYDDATKLLTPMDSDFRPFTNRTRFDLDNPDIHLLKLMRTPEFFPFTCANLFGKPDGSGPLEIAPFQHLILQELWQRQFPMLIGSRGLSKSFLLALYILLRLVFTPGSKVVIVASAFRQAKVVFEYMEAIWYASPVLRDIVGSEKGARGRESGPRRDIDRCEFVIGESVAVAIPLGSGSKIRGLRANYVICEEFSCLGKDTLIETDRGLMRIQDAENEMESKFGLLQPDGKVIVPNKFIKTPPTKAYKVVTEGNYEFTCSDIHKVQTMDGWKYGRDLTKDDYLPQKNEYVFPEEIVSQEGIEVDNDVAWLLGALTSEGCVSGKKGFMAVQTTDIGFATRTQSILKRLSPDHSVGMCTRERYWDDRGWWCKQSYVTYDCDLKLRDKLVRLGLARTTACDKKFPWSILQSPKTQMLSFLSGLFDGDGSAFIWKSRGKDNHLGVSYYSVSEQLAKEVQLILQKLDLFSYRVARINKLSKNPQWMVRLNGLDAHTLASMLNVPRFEKIVESACPPHNPPNKGVVWLKDNNQWRVQHTIKGKMKYFGRHKTKEEAIRICSETKPVNHLRVRSVTELPDERVLYDFHVPDTHQFFGNSFLQHNSVPEDIYSVVVQGFGAVTADPVQNMKDYARIKVLKKLGIWSEELDEDESKRRRGNQSIISGTAYYSFNHFCKYWKEYTAIINTQGDRSKLEEVLRGPIPESFNWRDYCVIRIPYEMIPMGFMDDKTITRARQITNTSLFSMEYNAVFANDSDGFFRRSLIEKCVVGNNDNPHPPSFASAGGRVNFTATIKGDPSRRYVYGVDPASENDAFAIVITEIWPDHRRVVFCWTTGKSDHREKLKRGVVKEHDFYRYCTRKLRDLFKTFPPERVLVDSGGGGISLREAFRDPDKLETGEAPVYEVVDPDPKKHKDEDDMQGMHLLEMVVFRNTAWVSEANHGMKKDMEDRVLLFPMIDPLALGLAEQDDLAEGRVVMGEDGQQVLQVHDTLESNMLEIEELKNELSTIVISATANGLEHWDTPDKKIQGQKKGKMRKDRYSALLMANAGARILSRTTPQVQYEGAPGGFSNKVSGGDIKNAPFYKGGPSWWQEGMRECGNYGRALGRGRGVRS